ncbi:Mite allergen Lep d 7, partial [Stegodyphus mimosarum]
MLCTFVTVLLVAGSALASPLANQYIDGVLNSALRNEIRAQRLDPAALQDFHTEFEDKVAIIGKVKGRADYNKGKLTGLSDARRYSECNGPYYSFGAKSINCTISFDNLKMEYDGKLKYGKMPKVNIKAKANITNTVIFIEVSSAAQHIPPSLKNFLFQHVGYMQMKFSGLGPLNKFTKFLEEGFKAYAEAQIFNS